MLLILAEALHDAAHALHDLHEPLGLVHGDCWFRNAIHTPAGDVTLIDWDCAGEGLLLLDVGYLLLSSHFDPARPLVLETDEVLIAAILRGYQEEGHRLSRNRAMIAYAMQYLLAFQLGQIVADAGPIHDDTLAFLQKLEVRYAVTHAIADIAIRYVD